MLYGIIALAVLLCLCGGALIAAINKNTRVMVLNDELERQLDDICRAKKQQDNENYRLSAENMRLQTLLQAQRQHMQERLQDIENNKKDLELKFRDISNEILNVQSRRLNESQSQVLSAVLSPFRDQLKAFRDEVSKANTESIRNKTSFDEQFKKLIDMNNSLSQDAQNLTNALRGSKKMQGDWGEIELNRILEVAGLQKNIDYFTQENFKNENNQNLRPDVVVRLPNNRSVIVDSKVSMNDYISYVNAEDETAKAAALQRHIQCIRNHIDELSGKEYQKLLKEESLDYVVIFIPIESAFVEAIKKDDSLYDYAYKKNVALTTPSSLLPILRTVENLWQIETRNKYVQKIAEVGGSLYDKLANFVDDMQKIDKALDAARTNYDTAISKLASGKGNALSLANRLKEYGAKANKQIGMDYDENEVLKISDNSNDVNNSEEKAS
ncbi:MAG TPA: hypothetical protein DD619_05430 [Alphaproteobacteria bacterium]|nr:hypothetical protein [Alphaproteobacteria bacterium]